MKGTWQTDGGGDQLAVLASVAVAGLMIWLIIAFIWVIAVAVGLVLVAVIGVCVWMRRHGPDVAMVAHAALPAPEATPMESRPVRALPAPQQLHIHFHGLDAAQAAEVVRRQAIDRREP